ncbi:HutD family protein [Achromobacter mucicolens]|uniref:HutD/Ves family protein n=1 Tax=Achromobacter mucicolens TaxID=1389922 RepID=UPI00244CD28D|nr:HutD family protein [Achromobacter mucicolens]MDH0092373.1 HutD family protein [Achromobacter mucicolens]
MARFPDSAGPLRASWLALPPEPWKNGGGVTRTLAADPGGRWRVSIADIQRDGPYSRFAGYDRVSVVLSGEGVTLQGEGVAVQLLPREPASFGGDTVLQSTLIGGPVRVLNLFVRRGEAAASVSFAGEAAGRCEVGGLPDARGRRALTRLVVAAQADGPGGQAVVPAALGPGEYLLARGGEVPGVDTPGVDTPGVATPGVATPGVATPDRARAASATSGLGFAVILDIAVHAAGAD